MRKIKTAVLGATGMVGQRFVTLLSNHPWFEVVNVAASPNSSGKTYQEAVKNRWYMQSPIPEKVKDLTVVAVEEDMNKIVSQVQLVFSALDLDKEKIRNIEDAYAKKGVAVVSNNSAHRWTNDVPMIMPEVNPHHVKLIDLQRKNRKLTTGLIAVKPNCSIQSYVTILTALKKYKPRKVHVTSLQSISGAGKTFTNWPEMIDNCIPFIGGEEEKSEKEPMKIWGELNARKIKPAVLPKITATCIRVPTTDGHMASVSVKFAQKPSFNNVIKLISNFYPLKDLNLPSSPPQLIKYFDEENRPQTKLDREEGAGMSITMGRLREDSFYDWKFIALSHNTIKGAAGGAILLAEFLVKKGYIKYHSAD